MNGDTIYNGAIDNASGTAGLLEIARAYTKLSTPPKRSILFASVTAEEQGLLGSQYYAANPVVPLAKTLADINMDGLNVHGRTKDVTIVGYGASDLDDYVRSAAAEQGRVIRPDPEPEKGFYYRSDHFNFAEFGVPALDPDAGVDFVGKPADYGRQVRDDYTEHDYHKPSDQVRPDWDMSGAREDLKLFLAVGYRVAQAGTFPEWKAGDEFKAKREAMLAAAAADSLPSMTAVNPTKPVNAADPVAEVEQFRAKHEADYTKDTCRWRDCFFSKRARTAPAARRRATCSCRRARRRQSAGSSITTSM